MAKRKRVYHKSYKYLKDRQGVVNRRSNMANSTIIDDLFVNPASQFLNKRRRSRIGHVEKANEL